MFYEASRLITNGAAADPDPTAGPIAVGLLNEISAVQSSGGPTARIEFALEAPSVEGIVVDLWIAREVSGDSALTSLPANRFYLLEAGIAIPGSTRVSRAIPRGGKVYVRMISETISADRTLYLAGTPDQEGAGASGGAAAVSIVGTPNVAVTSLPSPKGNAGPTSFASMANAMDILALSQYLAADPTLTNTQLLLPRVDVAGYALVKSPQFPAALGQTAKALAFSVVLASDDHQKGASGPIALAAAAEAANALTFRQYLSTDPVLTNTQLLVPRVTAAGFDMSEEQKAPNSENSVLGVTQIQMLPVVSPTFTWSKFVSAALATNHIVKAAPGVLRSVSGRIDITATGAPTTYYLLAMDSATLPADGTVSIIWSKKLVMPVVQVDLNFEKDFSANGVYFGSGLVFCLSTTEFTKTISASATLKLDSVLYK